MGGRGRENSYYVISVGEVVFLGRVSFLEELEDKFYFFSCLSLSGRRGGF